ncbi:hypothetical protein [Adlercreutzia equolifaciens]|uniref:Phage tail protein n=1 Tax=Adlercreutzia equolifaciens TaxID=446660 RepID=A0A6L8Q6B7_9ACTN|nr:hypothetical protein [Adlercreutzia equolifaciens]MZG28843.1 hypothetical protein [Adlercreutzia equolifaciens]
MMNPGISVEGYHSLDDFGWRLIDREETPPKLRQTKVTVPYANGSLDYTGVYGEAFYDEKAIAYTFAKDFKGVEDMMEGVREFVAWLSGIYNADIRDSMFEEFHNHGSCSDTSWEHAKSGATAKVTASFDLYPFMVADDESTAALEVGTNYVINEGRPVRLTAEPLRDWAAITVGGETVTVRRKQVTSLCLESGLVEIEVDGGGAVITWFEERM